MKESHNQGHCEVQMLTICETFCQFLAMPRTNSSAQATTSAVKLLHSCNVSGICGEVPQLACLYTDLIQFKKETVVPRGGDRYWFGVYLICLGPNLTKKNNSTSKGFGCCACFADTADLCAKSTRNNMSAHLCRRIIVQPPSPSVSVSL